MSAANDFTMANNCPTDMAMINGMASVTGVPSAPHCSYALNTPTLGPTIRPLTPKEKQRNRSQSFLPERPLRPLKPKESPGCYDLAGARPKLVVALSDPVSRNHLNQSNSRMTTPAAVVGSNGGSSIRGSKYQSLSNSMSRYGAKYQSKNPCEQEMATPNLNGEVKSEYLDKMNACYDADVEPFKMMYSELDRTLLLETNFAVSDDLLSSFPISKDQLVNHLRQEKEKSKLSEVGAALPEQSPTATSVNAATSTIEPDVKGVVVEQRPQQKRRQSKQPRKSAEVTAGTPSTSRSSTPPPNKRQKAAGSRDPLSLPHPYDWTCKQVMLWLKSIDKVYEKYEETFVNSCIDGVALMLLREEHMIDIMKIPLGHAVKIVLELQKLKTKYCNS